MGAVTPRPANIDPLAAIRVSDAAVIEEELASAEPPDIRTTERQLLARGQALMERIDTLQPGVKVEITVVDGDQGPDGKVEYAVYYRTRLRRRLRLRTRVRLQTCRIQVPRAWLANAPIEVCEAAIAHELGHVERLSAAHGLRREIARKRIGSRASDAWWLGLGCAASGVVAPSASLFPLAAAFISAGVLLQHARCLLNRREEYAADRIAAALVGPQPVIDCMRHLHRIGATSRYERWYRTTLVVLGLHTHPSDRNRIKAINAANPGGDANGHESTPRLAAAVGSVRRCQNPRSNVK